MTLSDLITKLEACEGPNRAIDGWIDAVLRVGAPKMKTGEFAWAWENFPTWTADTKAEGMCGLKHTGGGVGMVWESQRFTESVDAAISLAERVLPGRGRMQSKGRAKPHEPPYACFIMDKELCGDAETNSVIGEGEHHVEAIALCIAVLRALEQGG